MTRRKLLQHSTFSTLGLGSLIGCGGNSSKDTLFPNPSPSPTPSSVLPRAQSLGKVLDLSGLSQASNGDTVWADTGVLVQWPVAYWTPTNTFDQPLEYHIYRGDTLVGRAPYRRDSARFDEQYFPNPYFIDWSYVGPYESTSDSTEIVTTYRPEGGARALSIIVPHLSIGAQHVYEIKLVTGLREVSLGKTNPATCISLARVLGTRVGNNIISHTFSDLSNAEVRIQTSLGVTHYAIEIAFDDSRLPNDIQKKWIFPASDLQPIPLIPDVSNLIRQSLISLDISDLYAGGQSLGFRVSVGVSNQNDGQMPVIVNKSDGNSTYYSLKETPFLFGESIRIDYVPPK
jgi:hypothetical protein